MALGEEHREALSTPSVGRLECQVEAPVSDLCLLMRDQALRYVREGSAQH